MKLVVFELSFPVTQKITIGNRSLQLYALRPHIYRNNFASGSLTMQVQDSTGNLIASSDTVAISAIGSNSYWHGYQRFLISAQLKAFRSYEISMTFSGGYSFAEAAYIAWANDFDLRKVPANYIPNSGINAALDLEIWEMREVVRRTG